MPQRGGGDQTCTHGAGHRDKREATNDEIEHRQEGRAHDQNGSSSDPVVQKDGGEYTERSSDGDDHVPEESILHAGLREKVGRIGAEIGPPTQRLTGVWKDNDEASPEVSPLEYSSPLRPALSCHKTLGHLDVLHNAAELVFEVEIRRIPDQFAVFFLGLLDAPLLDKPR